MLGEDCGTEMEKYLSRCVDVAVRPFPINYVILTHVLIIVMLGEDCGTKMQEYLSHYVDIAVRL